jgi:hypothetical protein
MKVGRAIAIDRRHRTCGVSDRGFDFEHIGAKVGKDCATKWTCDI